MKTASYQFSGLFTGGMQNMNVSANGNNRVGIVRRSSQKQTVKKQLNYNPREIRSALVRASKSQSAGKVLCQAKGKLSTLLKCKGTGQYNETELANAIVHARRMVQCAQMKTRNLRKEEQLQKKYAKEAKAEEQSQKNDMKLRIKRKEQNLEQKEKMETMQRVRKQRQHHQEIIRKRRMHRTTELGKMDEADLEYKKNMDRDSRSDAACVSYDVYMPVEGVELNLSDDGLKLTEEQLEQQAELMLQAELGMTGISEISPDVSAASAGAALSAGTAALSSGGAEAATVDIAV